MDRAARIKTMSGSIEGGKERLLLPPLHLQVEGEHVVKPAVSDIAFTPLVKAVRERLGSRNGHAAMGGRGGWNDTASPELKAVLEAIASCRDLPALFHELGGQLVHVVHFDFMSLVLHAAATDTLRLHVLETGELVEPGFEIDLRPEDDPAGSVWQTQQPLITSNMDELRRWPRLLERVKAYGVQSFCWLPLTTARRRLGALVFTSKQPAAYDNSEIPFLQLVASQVAVAVENALAFQEIESLKDKLAKEKAYLEEEVRTEHRFGDIVGENAALRAILKQVETVAPTDSTVLIRGDTGTGKELIARAVHDLSPRKGRTFVKLNCAAIPTGLLESELFGNEKGAFTGAISQRIGRFELAHQGTLFLDEVADIPLELQPKLLRVLQEHEFERLGSTKTIRVNVRVVAATNRDLAEMMAEGRFRSDLYYRLNVFPITLPPLRERPDDIPRLVRHFTQGFARRMGRRIESIPSSVMDALVGYAWPGNVRELQNVIERAVILSPGTTLQVVLADLHPAAAQASASTAAPAAVTLTDAEREHIMRALRDANWVLGGPKGAAARLGMNRSTLHWKMKKLGISRPE
jgi:formate hydrogenlyase transcriptional activator